MFIVELFIIAKIGKPSKWSSADKEIKKKVQWNIIHPSKEWEFAICNNVDGPRKFYA